MHGGFELRVTDGKGTGVFATDSFQIGDTVMVGIIERELEHNHSHASQVGEHRFVVFGSLVTLVNHS